MAERIFELPGPVAVKLVFDGLPFLRAGRQRPLDERIDVFHVETDADG
jgi:hypothetical protein